MQEYKHTKNYEFSTRVGTIFIILIWARVVCLINLPDAQELQAQGQRVDISGRPCLHIM